MTLSWVAAGVRARSLLHRTLDDDAVHGLAAAQTLGDGLERLLASPYGRDVRTGQSLVDAQRAIASTALWHLRVLGGWLTGGGAEAVRVVAGRWEIANVAGLLASLETGEPAAAAYDLGHLATLPHRIAGAQRPADVRRALARSAWRDPGTDEPAELLAWMRLRWAERIARDVPGGGRIGAGRLALEVARERFVAGRRPGRRGWPASPLGVAWERAETLDEYGERLPGEARWALEGIAQPSELWRAERRWWSELDAAATRTLEGFHPGSREEVVAAAALLALDAWRVRGALGRAARGGSEEGTLDAHP